VSCRHAISGVTACAFSKPASALTAFLRTSASALCKASIKGATASVLCRRIKDLLLAQRTKSLLSCNASISDGIARASSSVPSASAAA
jgi:hypothetical protein